MEDITKGVGSEGVDKKTILMDANRAAPLNPEEKRVSINDLIFDAENARLHPEKNIKAIRASLTEFGQVEPLIVARGSNIVVGGNGRLEAMREQNKDDDQAGKPPRWKSVNVIYVDVNEKTRKALALALNRTAELAEWDYSELSSHLAELERTYAGIAERIGWDQHEIDVLLAAEWKPPVIDPDYESPDLDKGDKEEDEEGDEEDGRLIIRLNEHQTELFLEIAGENNPGETVEKLCRFYQENRKA